MLSIAHCTKNFANNQSLIGSLKIFPRAEIEQCINPRLDHLGGNFNFRSCLWAMRLFASWDSVQSHI